jgi:hypothetical protein
VFNFLSLLEWCAWSVSHELGQLMCWGGVIKDREVVCSAGLSGHNRRHDGHAG